MHFHPILGVSFLQLEWVYEKKQRAQRSKRAEDSAEFNTARKRASHGTVLSIKALQDGASGRLERFVALLCPKEEAGAAELESALDSCRETAPQPFEWLREFTFHQKREPQWDEPNQMLALFAGGSGAVGDRFQLGSASKPEGHTLSYVPVEKRLQTRRRVRRQGPGSEDMVDVELPKEVTVKRRAPTAEEEERREGARRRLEAREEDGREEEEARGGGEEDLFGDADDLQG